MALNPMPLWSVTIRQGRCLIPHAICPCPVAECIDLHLRCARLTNPNVCCVGISVNTFGINANRRVSYLTELSKELGLPCVDPIQDGCEEIVDRIFTEFTG